ncbi:excisionase family DNA-binding protein [Paraburkholderia sp. MM5477-R1]|uniref:excisionase family DNA-binding protein n=1 Tax=Paraburkholderia sp. MM5477-R1 TaxID=2991062 RepID=UPI003D198141
MSTKARISPPSEADAMALAHKRMEEMFRNLGSRVPAEVQRELSSGVDAIIGEVLSLHFSRRADADDFMSTADAAKLLFVSRPHVVKMLKEGKLKLHHKTGNNRFVMKASVLDYQADQRAAAQAYQASTADEE